MPLYPPIMESSQEAFLASTSSEPIYFTLSNLTRFNDIGHIQIRVVYQSNNKSAVNTKIYPDGVIYKLPGAIYRSSLADNLYYVNIDRNDLAENWRANKYYKVQICFGTTGLWGSGDFAEWKANQVQQSTFGEWSTVMVIKAIPDPTIEIANQGSAHGGSGDLIIESSSEIELTTTPLFHGHFTCSGEAEDKYRFTITRDGEIEPLEDSGWLQHDNENNMDTHRFSHILEDEVNYVVTYEVITVNLYHAEAIPYNFMVNVNFLTKLENINLLVEDCTNQEEPYCNENACINIRLTTTRPLSGNYVITRSSEKTNYTIWEDLKFLIFSNRTFDSDIIFQDFTVESGVKYISHKR